MLNEISHTVGTIFYIISLDREHLFTKAQNLYFCENMFGVRTADSGNIQYLGSNSIYTFDFYFLSNCSDSPCAITVAYYTFIH